MVGVTLIVCAVTPWHSVNELALIDTLGVAGPGLMVTVTVIALPAIKLVQPLPPGTFTESDITYVAVYEVAVLGV